MRSDTLNVGHSREALAPQGFRACGAVPVAPAVRTGRETTSS